MTRYPLEALGAVREQAERTAEERLAAALDARARAAAAVEEARATLEAHRRAEATRRREADRLTGTTTSAALLREEAFRRRQDRETEALRREIERARERERAAARGVEAAREALNDAAVEKAVVERHRARWEAERAKVLERRSEEALEEAARGRR